MERKIQIAIDGPAAAGKSTTAKLVASRLSYIYIDTGAMYRSITYKALQNGINLEDGEALGELLAGTEITLKQGVNGQNVFLDGVDVTDSIRTDAVTNNVSNVARHSEVRRDMTIRQQQLAAKGGVVMDGRDIGTSVLPGAELKIFLLAGVEERAKRRHAENLKKGFSSDLENLKREIAERDRMDTERVESPLKKADDAIEIDTTFMTIEQVVEAIMANVIERIG
ncbi:MULTISPECIES: (d)CMP kinase [Bacillaceae]|uniref:Cytidylate kinase n=1 Tax=Domibacillus aminovorans TaxID=29332 RepID=A0A177KRC5_9BACI|nr:MULTISPECIES: (d)CMP kinase [Bacillaceae]OAH55910.1 cytidylate kinase [Domibacillus aminovorans]OAH58211.1 cytidylate kinase [Domibacillus aminovorans]